MTTNARFLFYIVVFCLQEHACLTLASQGVLYIRTGYRTGTVLVLPYTDGRDETVRVSRNNRR